MFLGAMTRQGHLVRSPAAGTRLERNTGLSGLERKIEGPAPGLGTRRDKKRGHGMRPGGPGPLEMR